MNPTGTYNATLKKAVLSKSKSSGSLQFALVFDITHYQDANGWADLAPFERTVFLSLSGGAKDYTKKKMASLGWTGPPKTEKDPQTGEQLLVMPEGVSDAGVQLMCKHEDYNGQTQERWDLANWGGSVTGEQADDEDAMKLAAIW